ncbi:MAG: ABC transporter ATP-binding protein [Actinomycetota bacterium]|nr:ABC transporter ATP-binding protein [Actinomycetota bacterium]
MSNVSKRFRLYKERNQSLKSTLLQRRRGTFEEFWALRDVSLDVPRGTAMGLIGENGSGKSTLLKCMAKILRPDEGTIVTDGKVSALLELGAGFHHELSGRENVYLNGSILGLSKTELDRKFDGIVEFAGLERFIDSPVKNYSSGMYLRLGFSVAINVNPDVLLVDEVLAVGDEVFQRRCREKFAELRAKGSTVVLVSHALESIRNLCDIAAWLDGGTLKMMGPVDDVIDHYLHVVGGGDSGDAAAPGSGGNAITQIELLDHAHLPVREALTGDTVVFRFHYRLDGTLGDPVFGMAVHTDGGMELTATTFADSGTKTAGDGRGHVDLVVDSLPLLPGTYDVSATITDPGTGQVVDAHDRSFRFVVDAGTPHGSIRGIVDLGGTWHAHPSLPVGDVSADPR